MFEKMMSDKKRFVCALMLVSAVILFLTGLLLKYLPENPAAYQNASAVLLLVSLVFLLAGLGLTDVADKVLTFFEEWTLFVTVIVALVALFFNVVLRYGFNYSLAWSEELVRLVIIYTTLIGCSAAVKNRSMIKIDAMVQIFPRLKAPLAYFSNGVTLIFAGMMIYYGYLMAALQAMTNQKTIIMKIPLVWLYAVLPLMGGMMFVRTVRVICEDIIRARAEKA